MFFVCKIVLTYASLLTKTGASASLERDVNNSNVIPMKMGIQSKLIAFLSGFPGQARE